jgi:hypothetical protein
MKRNRNQAVRNSSRHGAATQTKIQKRGSAAGIDKGRGLAFRFINDSGATLASLKLDERQSTLLQRVAAATGLTWGELFAFILDRQLEAFFPSDDTAIFSVREDATGEIDRNFEKAERAATAVRAVSEEMTFRLQTFVEKQPLPNRGFLAQLPGMFCLIERLSVSAHVGMADARTHWTGSARPALLEHHTAPASVPLARAAA